MKWNFLYQITAASRLGGYRSPRSPFSLSSTEFVEPPPTEKKIPGYATAAFWKWPPTHSHAWFRRNWNTRKPYSKYPTTLLQWKSSPLNSTKYSRTKQMSVNCFGHVCDCASTAMHFTLYWRHEHWQRVSHAAAAVQVAVQCGQFTDLNFKLGMSVYQVSNTSEN